MMNLQCTTQSIAILMMSIIFSMTLLIDKAESAFVHHHSSTTTTSTSYSVRTTTHSPPFAIGTHRRLHSTANSNNDGGESEAQRLLRKARELRAQADMDEQKVHSELADKKAKQDAHLDELVDYLLKADGGADVDGCCRSKQGVVDRLHKKMVSMDTLEKILDRLDERIIMASGQEHVKATTHGSTNRVDFHRVSAKQDRIEADRLEAMIDRLLEAVQVLDDEFKEAKLALAEGTPSGSTRGSLLYSVTAVESQHWGGGQCAQRLQQRLGEKRREREDQFLKRQEEFYEAQRVKKNRPPPPKAKDDHGFLK